MVFLYQGLRLLSLIMYFLRARHACSPRDCAWDGHAYQCAVPLPLLSASQHAGGNVKEEYYRCGWSLYEVEANRA
jgi:hypothetical protein